MSYEPKEGVDYVVDLYAVSGVPAEAAPDELKLAINERIKEYHPDRLQTVAPEFRSKGERMAALLNRARFILLDDERRTEYDEILDTWDGPVSKDGTPVITLNRQLQVDAAGKTPEEIEEECVKRADYIERTTGYSPDRIAFLEGLIDKSEGQIDDLLRAEYESALAQKDQVLTMQEVGRSQLLGLHEPEVDEYTTTLDYGKKVQARLESAATAREEQLQIQALGTVSTRLSVLAGEEIHAPEKETADAATIELPAYFDSQAVKIQEIAEERADVLRKRLDNLQPTYPEEELQTEFREELAIGISEGVWISAKLDSSEGAASLGGLPANIEAHLKEGNFRAVIEGGYNVLTLGLLERVDVQDQVIAALEKYTDKYEDASQ